MKQYLDSSVILLVEFLQGLVLLSNNGFQLFLNEKRYRDGELPTI